MSPGPSHRHRGLALVGYRGTGKSTVGRLLAERLAWSFADADVEIEARAGRSIVRIFAEQGEPAFRELESATLRDLAARDRLVLATGGGAVIRPENRRLLGDFGFVAWLRADPLVLAERLRAETAGRPALTAAGTLDEIADVLATRSPLYDAVSHARVETDDRTPAEVADLVLTAFRVWAREQGVA